MTPKEKAIEIYNKFYGIPLYIKTIKQCCYIVVDEIIKEYGTYYKIEVDEKYVSYWEQVKIEIEKI